MLTTELSLDSDIIIIVWFASIQCFAPIAAKLQSGLSSAS